MHYFIPGQLLSQVRKAKPGKLVQYYRGYIYNDRLYNEAVDDLAKEAWFLYKRGKVHLLQERHGDWDYTYYFVKR